jgi:hypothetical protein
MDKISISDVPEHLERVIIRPLVETFSYNYMYKHKFENFVIKMIEYDKKKEIGNADVYFSLRDGTYTHLMLEIPVHKKVVNGKTQVTVEDPIITKLNKEPPHKKI